MKPLTGADQKLMTLFELLRSSGGLRVSAQIFHTDRNELSLRPELVVQLTGMDTALLTNRNGELLHAIEHVAAKLLGLEPEEHDRISLDADNFKANRQRELQQLADAAVIKVRTTATAYTFPPMMSRERRLLHLVLASSGLKSASTGERFHRSVVLYPEGALPGK